MAAMFQAQTVNWEETQEKMSQLVSRPGASPVLCSRTISHELCFVLLVSLYEMNSAQRIYTNRGTGFTGRGGAKPHASHTQFHHQPDRPLPPSYVCYRCGKKG